MNQYLRITVLCIGIHLLGGAVGATAESPTLRFDFESGDLQGWQVVAGAFYKPVRAYSGPDSSQAGQFYLTTEGATAEIEGSANPYSGGGIIESPVFVIRGPEARFLVRGLASWSSSVTLHLESGKEVRRSRLFQPGNLSPQRWDLDGLRGRRAFLRLADSPKAVRSYVAIDEFEVAGEIDEEATSRHRAELRRRNESALAPALKVLERSGDIIFAVRQPGKNRHYYVNFGRWCHNPNQWEYGSGGRLCRMDPRSGRVSVLLDDPEGAVRDPQVRYEAQKILFSYRPGGSHRFHLYEIDSDGSNLRQLTDGDFDDIEPTYLPTGEILFCSTRARRVVNCNLVEVALLFVCDADGDNIRQVSSNNETENTPWPLPDGQVLFTRWEYIDRSIGPFKALWSMSPDGSGVMTYFGNMNPGIYIDAKPIPGSKEVVLIETTHMGREHIGTLGILDASTGPDHRPSVRTIGWEGDLRDPYPLGQAGFLVAREGRLMVIARDGSARTLHELSEADRKQNYWIHEPRLLEPRKREPVVASRVDLAKATGQLLLADVCEGRNMAGVEPGDIEKLLVVEVLPKPVNFSGQADPVGFDHTFTLFRILGTVPVEKDGSAWMEVPAMRSLLFVALDKNDRSVKRMQSFVTVQPGEVKSCIGCHEPRTQTPGSSYGKLRAFDGRPQRILPFDGVPEVIDFPRDIQPVLDRHCLACHDYDATDQGGPRAGGVILGGDHGPTFSHSFAVLHMRDLVVCDRRGNGNMPPRSLGSGASPLMDYLDGGHHGVRLSDHERRILRLWMDVSAPYAGTYAASGTGDLKHGQYGPRNSPDNPNNPRWPPRLAAKAVIERRCAGCHSGERRLPSDPLDVVGQKGYTIVKELFPRRVSHHIVFNLSRPKKSLLLLAPLTRAQGGYEICRSDSTEGPVFSSTADSDYLALLDMIRASKALLDANPRFDRPDFQPSPHYVREMQRMGVVPRGKTRAPINVYASDEAYWRSFWWRPVTRDREIGDDP